MSDATTLRDELHALKTDLAALLAATGDVVREQAATEADLAADHIKSMMAELGDTLERQELHIEKWVTERPVAALASAFALGVVAGLLLRRLK